MQPFSVRQFSHTIPPTPIRILVLGRGGQLGTALCSFSQEPLWQVTGVSHQELDITDKNAIKDFFEVSGPFACVINAAGVLPVDRAESHPNEALSVNGIALENLAKICRAQDVLLVHFSTDHVFDGKTSIPHRETDPKNPLNVYGRSKLIGDLILETIGGPYIIVRTSWLFGAQGNDFVTKVWEWSHEDREISIVDDQIGCPTHTGDVVQALSLLIARYVDTRDPSCLGTFHLCGEGETSWFEFAHTILDEIKRIRPTSPLRLTPISTADFSVKNPSVAPRPLYSTLDCTKIKIRHGITPNPWKSQVPGLIKILDTGSKERTKSSI